MGAHFLSFQSGLTKHPKPIRADLVFSAVLSADSSFYESHTVFQDGQKMMLRFSCTVQCFLFRATLRISDTVRTYRDIHRSLSCRSLYKGISSVSPPCRTGCVVRQVAELIVIKRVIFIPPLVHTVLIYIQDISIRIRDISPDLWVTWSESSTLNVPCHKDLPSTVPAVREILLSFHFTHRPVQ